MSYIAFTIAGVAGLIAAYLFVKPLIEQAVDPFDEDALPANYDVVAAAGRILDLGDVL